MSDITVIGTNFQLTSIYFGAKTSLLSVNSNVGWYKIGKAIWVHNRVGRCLQNLYMTIATMKHRDGRRYAVGFFDCIAKGADNCFKLFHLEF